MKTEKIIRDYLKLTEKNLAIAKKQGEGDAIFMLRCEKQTLLWVLE